MRASLGHAASYIPRIIAHAVTFASGIITATIRPASDSTTAVRVQNAAGSTSLMTFDTTNSEVGILTTPSTDLDVAGTTGVTIGLTTPSSSNAGILFLRRRDTTIGAGNNLGRIDFTGDDATAVNTAAISIRGSADGDWTGGTDTPGVLTFWTAPATTGVLAERFRINATGIHTITGSLIVNETGLTTGDLRAESDTEENMLFLDASADTLFLGGSVALSVAKGGALSTVSYAQLTEMVAPGAGAANTARIYAVDNGAGKTQLMVQFATGTPIQLAIEA